MDSIIGASSPESLQLFSTATDLFHAAAEDFVIRSTEIIKQKGVCNVVLSGGNTPKSFFDALTHVKEKISWGKIRFFFGDERYVPLDNPQSNYYTAHKFLFSNVSIPTENIFPIPTELASAEESAQQYEKTLRTLFHLQDFQWPAFDITYLGMGDNGHTASLMPFSELVKSYVEGPPTPTLVASLWAESLGMYRVTLTPPALNHSAYIAFLVEGETKASALKKVIEHKKHPLKYPAILIKNAVWYIDQAAGNQLSTLLTLCIDIGGTGVKMLVLDNNGNTKTEYQREPTPHPATYAKLSELLKKMIHEQQKAVSFDRVSAGFPGVVIDGIVKTAHNLDPSWVGKNLQKKLEHISGKPARVANDADVQGMGDICGKGVELVITLGTGVGSALFINGELVPNLQLAHHPFIDNKTYEDYLGEAAFKEHGKAKWNTYLQHAIALWQQTFNYHHLYLGGGYAKKVTFVLPENIKISNNIEGVLGGVKLWTT